VAEAGLTPGLARVLAQMPLGAAVPMRELAAGLRCDSSYVTSVVDALEEHGLAERQAHPTDRRVKVIRLTPAGQGLAQRVQAELASPPPCFGALSDDEIEELCQLLAKLRQGRALAGLSPSRLARA